MPKPSTAPTWATDANFSGGAAVGQPTKVDPAGAESQGHVPGGTFYSGWLNWFLNLLGAWVGWVAEGTPEPEPSSIVERDAEGASRFGRVTVTADNVMAGVRRLHFFAEQVVANTLMLSIPIPNGVAGTLRLTAAAWNTSFGLSSANSFVRSYRIYNDGGAAVLGPDLNTNATPDAGTSITVTANGNAIEITLTVSTADEHFCDGWVDYSLFGEE